MKVVGPGWIRNSIPFHLGLPLLVGTGALVVWNALTLGFEFEVEGIRLASADTLVGASGSQTFVVRKGSTTGTAVVSVVPTVASQATIGSVISASAAYGTAAEIAAARFLPTDTISITRTAGGTTITAGVMSGLLLIRQRPQTRV